MSKAVLSVEFTQEAIKRLDKVMKRIGASSRLEVVQRAMALLEFFSGAKLEKGGTLFVRYKDGTEAQVEF